MNEIIEQLEYFIRHNQWRTDDNEIDFAKTLLRILTYKT